MSLEQAKNQRIFTHRDWPLGVGGQLRRRLRGLEVELDCDVVIVGSGAGGGVMASELAEAGLDVVVVEEGSHYKTEEFSAEAAHMVRKLYRDGGLSLALGNPPVFFAEGRCIGGSTLINGGMSWRTPEKVLSCWNHEHGLDRGDAKSMEPYFARVERFISASYQDPESKSPDNELLKAGAERKGWRVIENIRNQLHCAGSNNCAFGCPTAAKRSTLVSYLPRAMHFGARVYADCRVDRVLRRGRRAVGVSGRVLGSDRRPLMRFSVRARHVVLSAGAIHTPALLMRSGVRSPSHRLGANLTLHPNIKVTALFDHDVFGWKGVHQHYQVREFDDDGLLLAAVNMPPALLAMSLPAYGEQLGELMQRYNRMVVAGVLVEDSVTGKVRCAPNGQPMAFYQLTERDRQRFVKGARLLSELMFAAGAREVYLPFEHLPPVTSADAARRLEDQTIPVAGMEVGTVHLMGTVASGGDPTRHVCDPYGRVYGHTGLTVADASLFPTPVGVNPMETVMALATRNAERLLEDNAARA